MGVRFVGTWQLGREVSDDVVRKQSHEALGQMVGRMGFKMFCLDQCAGWDREENNQSRGGKY